MIVPVILSGGAGTRLWPLSRELAPKQLVQLIGSTTLLQKTVLRLRGIDDLGAPVIVCNHAHHGLVVDQLAKTGVEPFVVLLEPVGRNTAPAAAVAALAVGEENDPVLLVLPADHVISDVERFHEAVAIGHRAAQSGHLVTFGIVPDSAHTGYGYIEQGEPLGDGAIRRVARFVEKPDQETADGYLAGGRHLWNSGMFMFRASRYLEELESYEPAMLAGCRHAWQAADPFDGALRLDPETFRAIKGDSIDYAVMERTERAVVVPLDAGWSDVGSFPGLWEISHHDEHGNTIQGEVLAEGTTNSYLRAGDRLVAVIGLDQVIVVETSDAVLVCHKDHAQEVKTIVERLRQANRPEAVRPSE